MKISLKRAALAVLAGAAVWLPASAAMATSDDCQQNGGYIHGYTKQPAGSVPYETEDYYIDGCPADCVSVSWITPKGGIFYQEWGWCYAD